MSEGEERISIFESIRRLIERKIFSNNTRYGIIKTILYKRKGAAMNQSIGQQFAVFRYEKNILIVEEITSAGRCGSFNAASLCPASACRYDSAAWGFFVI